MTDTIVWVPVMVMTSNLTDVQRLIVIGSNWPDVLLEEDNADPRGLFFFEGNNVGNGPMVAFRTHWLGLEPKRPRHAWQSRMVGCFLRCGGSPSEAMMLLLICEDLG